MKTFSALKRLACAALAVTMLAGVVAGCGGEKKEAAKAPAKIVKINFPTAGASGALYAVGAAITNNWTKNVPGVQAASQASAGGIANLNMVSNNEAQVSIAISSNVLQCLNGTDSFKGHAYKDLKVIGGLYMNPNQVVATNKSGIKTLADVKGKHFAVAAAGSAGWPCGQPDAVCVAVGADQPHSHRQGLASRRGLCGRHHDDLWRAGPGGGVWRTGLRRSAGEPLV